MFRWDSVRARRRGHPCARRAVEIPIRPRCHRHCRAPGRRTSVSPARSRNRQAIDVGLRQETQQIHTARRDTRIRRECDNRNILRARDLPRRLHRLCKQRSDDDLRLLAAPVRGELRTARSAVVLHQQLNVGIVELGDRHLGRVTHRLRGARRRYRAPSTAGSARPSPVRHRPRSAAQAEAEEPRNRSRNSRRPECPNTPRTRSSNAAAAAMRAPPALASTTAPASCGTRLPSLERSLHRRQSTPHHRIILIEGQLSQKLG